MADFETKRGDTAPSVVVVLKDRLGNPVNLSTATGVQFVMRATSALTNVAPLVNGAMTIAADQTANTGMVTYDWIAGDTDHAGTFNAECVVTWSAGREQTFPTTGFISVLINDDIESHLASVQREMAHKLSPLGLVQTSDAAVKAQLALKCAAAVAPLLTDDDLTALVAYSRTTTGGYRVNRAAAEGWRWKAARAAGGFSFSADGTKVDKTMIVEHCMDMVRLYTKSQVRTVVADSGYQAFEGYYQ